jgi:thiamine transporter ThiT
MGRRGESSVSAGSLAQVKGTKEKIMAGIVTGGPKIISARTHAVIDYIHAATNFAVAGIFWKRNRRRAAKGAFALGAAVLGNALMTDYPGGVFRLYPFKVHGILDYGVAAASGFMPEITGIRPHTGEGKFFRAQGTGETAIAAISNYDDKTGARRFR